MATYVLADLHVHSALSPCAADDMTPPAILLSAERRGVAIVAVVDHGTARNARAILEAAPAFRVKALVGLEVESAEGVHLLALFDTAEAALEMDSVVAGHLPEAENRPEILGRQLLLNEWGEVIAEDKRLLVAATDLGIEKVADLAIRCGGLCIPAHIDRSANGLLHVLGFVPPNLYADAFELSRHISLQEALCRWPSLGGLPLTTSSDAHSLSEIGTAGIRVPADLATSSVSGAAFSRAFAEALRQQQP